MTSEMIHVARHLYLRRLEILEPFVTCLPPTNGAGTLPKHLPTRVGTG